MRKCLIVILSIIIHFSLAHSQIISPDDFLGFPLGADRMLADHNQITEYFEILDEASSKLKVINLGKSTDGNDLIIAIISSAENMGQLGKFQQMNKQLAKLSKLSPDKVESIIQHGKVTAFITCNIHATEIGANQMSMEFAYELITRTDSEVKFYLDNVILILMPSANPDGQLMVTDWYRKWVGTKYEGGRMPWLYHRYVGHDTNRDFFMLNQKESKLINKVMSKDWLPQVHLDEHQMGNRGPRMFVPPYKDPMSPNLSPLLMRLEALYGSNMSFRLEENGKAGVIDSWVFDSYWPGGTRTAAWKNIVSLLTELASCDKATPVYVEENELSGGGKGMAEYKQQVNFPNPWKGGWWRLRDIIDYELIASYSFLETSAKFREDILRSFLKMNLEAINRGNQEPPYAFIIPVEQHDNITAIKLIDLLLEHGIDVFRTTEELIIKTNIYAKGSFIIPLSQSLRPFIMEMLGVQTFPEIRLSRNGEMLYPYDVTSWSLPIQMGICCEAINEPYSVEKVQIFEAFYPAGQLLDQSRYGYVIQHEFNNTSIAINRLLKKGISVYVAESSFENKERIFNPGSIIVLHETNIHSILDNIAKDLHLTIFPLIQHPPTDVIEISSARLGLYKPWRASKDEGWTRWLLEQYEFDLSSISNEVIKKGQLNKKLDVLIIPDIGKQTIISPKPKDPKSAKFYRPLPEKYEGGIGKDGIKNLKEFVKNGGTLITLDSGCMLPIDEFPLPITNTLENVSRDKHYTPGVMLKMNIDISHPIGWGMPENFAAFVSRSPAFKTSSTYGEIERTVVAKYPNETLLLSGWIKGEKLLHRRASIVDVKYGKGKVILLGFRVQHRAQPHGTFKLLFNSIHYGGLVSSD